MKRARGRDQRGTVSLFTLATLSFILAIGGFAIDLVHLTAVRSELQRSVESAALAGAGGLRFGSYAFDPTRASTQAYGGLNGTRVGTVALNANVGNAADGNITLGVYTSGPPPTFVPSTDGLQVNAVRAYYATAIPASFLGILGFANLDVATQAIAVASPPLEPPANTCLLPIGLSRCAFEVPGVGPNTSNGCGRLVAFVVSLAVPAGSPVTAAWVDLPGSAGATMGQRVLNAFNSVANNAACPVTLSVANSPQLQAASTLAVAPQLMSGPVPPGSVSFIAAFDAKWAASPDITVTDSAGTPVYTGRAWVTYVPVIDTGCPPPQAPFPIAGARTIVGWTRFVIRGIDDQSNVHGSLPPGAVPAFGRQTIYGYNDCTIWDAPYNPNPAPITALSRRLHLVR